jgi:hypothetical protein
VVQAFCMEIVRTCTVPHSRRISRHTNSSGPRRTTAALFLMASNMASGVTVALPSEKEIK